MKKKTFSEIRSRHFYILFQVSDLRQELASRNLNSKGLKSQLMARLQKAIKLEQAKEEGRQDDVEDNEKDLSPPPKEESKDDKKSKDKDVNFHMNNFYWRYEITKYF